ncbi:MAG: hypothetical protein ACOZAM_15950 [Pseudomonadota bacterium]
MHMLDLAGTWWAAVIILSTTLLGCAIGYGVWQWNHAPRDAETMRRKDAATRANFKESAVEERTMSGEPVDKP